MEKYLSLFLCFIVCCKTHPNSDRIYDRENQNEVYQLHLNPPAGSSYLYDIANESEFKVELGDKNVNNISKTNVGIIYALDKDTLGNYNVHMHFSKIHIFSKNENGETNLDAENAANSEDPTEKMLGILKNSIISANIDPRGQMRSVSGYKEIASSFLSTLKFSDDRVKGIARQQLDKIIDDQMIKKNIDEIFRIFPDSGVHVGDRWKLDRKESGEIDVIEKNNYFLREIHDGIADIESEGDIFSDSARTNLMGYEVNTNLKGHQTGSYQIDTKTGMLVKATISTKIGGNIQTMAREIPIEIETSVKMERQ
jgi:Family of unknown function (DUF6263)